MHVFFLILVHYLLFSSASAIAAPPPEVLDFDIYLLDDRATTHTNEFGYNQFITDTLRDPDWFTSIEDCDCYAGGRDPNLEENCQYWDNDHVCFCKTIADSDQYQLIVSYDDLGRQTSLSVPGGLVGSIDLWGYFG